MRSSILCLAYLRMIEGWSLNQHKPSMMLDHKLQRIRKFRNPNIGGGGGVTTSFASLDPEAFDSQADSTGGGDGVTTSFASLDPEALLVVEPEELEAFSSGTAMAVVYFEDEENGEERAAPDVATSGGLNADAALNFAAISLFALTALYQLLHVDVEATIALFQFNDAMEASALATSIDLFRRLPLDALHGYEELVPTNPIYYKACTSGVAYALGDFISQIYQGRTLESFDLQRTARSSAAGFIGHGPLCHYWMSFMETYLDFGGAWWGTGVKVLFDQTVWGLYLNGVYSFLTGILAGRPLKEVWGDVKLTSWPALRTSWRFWPFVHAISFSHAVPLDLKLLWVDTMEIVWVTLLSKVTNDDKEAAKAEAEMTNLSGDPLASSSESAAADPALAATTAAPFDAAALAKAGWTAGWPLLAMWPFLFGVFEVEQQLGFETASVPESDSAVLTAVAADPALWWHRAEAAVVGAAGEVSTVAHAAPHSAAAAAHVASTALGGVCDAVAVVCEAAANGRLG